MVALKENWQIRFLRRSLSKATVTVLNPKDSSVVSFTVANEKGEFEIKDHSRRYVYRLLVTFQGYDNYSKNFMISPGFSDRKSQYNLFGCKGYDPSSGSRSSTNPVKKDTVEFRANAFKTKPNSTAEDVLKKVPGVQVDKEGNVTAQGENVQKVYVDGKEFFGTDPKIATKNITADMIESIQVFDDMSDQAKFTNMDDGSRAKTINIKLKKDKTQGIFRTIHRW